MMQATPPIPATPKLPTIEIMMASRQLPPPTLFHIPSTPSCDPVAASLAQQRHHLLLKIIKKRIQEKERLLSELKALRQVTVCPRQRAHPPGALLELAHWFFLNPYPTNEQKKTLAERDKTGLSVGQVSVWFANARARKIHSK